MNDAKREILTRVFTGEITAQEAAIELQGLDGPGETSSGSAGSATAMAPVRRLRVLASMGSVTVIGDPSVLEATADGPHVARHEGDTLVIESTHHEGHGFVFGGSRVRFGLETRDSRLVIRMNPSLALDVKCEAGSLRIEGVRAPIRASAHAGSVKILGFSHPIDLEVQAGSVKASGILVAGASRVRCHAGSVKLELDPTSSVTISAQTSLGRISLPESAPVASLLGGRTSAKIGDGAASLDIESEMGSVSVSVGQ
ncbi:MAG: DUF4097 domain-containing protein [Candidatus Dormibacteraeota bacterium]|nr:DUF4097 domain-containing protein [Candidatus Dormibacteraeota bacterium]